jgi:hypothetical protein
VKNFIFLMIAFFWLQIAGRTIIGMCAIPHWSTWEMQAGNMGGLNGPFGQRKIEKMLNN